VIWFCQIDPRHIESFQASEDKVAYAAKLVATWALRNKTGEMAPVGVIDGLSKEHKALIVSEFERMIAVETPTEGSDVVKRRKRNRPEVPGGVEDI
jgi:hypothetical protein